MKKKTRKAMHERKMRINENVGWNCSSSCDECGEPLIYLYRYDAHCCVNCEEWYTKNAVSLTAIIAVYVRICHLPHYIIVWNIGVKFHLKHITKIDISTADGKLIREFRICN